jgi:hypothetical protein
MSTADTEQELVEHKIEKGRYPLSKGEYCSIGLAGDQEKTEIKGSVPF